MISYAYEGAAMEKDEQSARNAVQTLRNLGPDVSYIFWIFNQHTLRVTRDDDAGSALAKLDELKKREHYQSDKAVISRAFELGMSFDK